MPDLETQSRAPEQAPAETWRKLLETVHRLDFAGLTLDRELFYQEAKIACGGDEPGPYLDRLHRFLGLR